MSARQGARPTTASRRRHEVVPRAGPLPPARQMQRPLPSRPSLRRSSTLVLALVVLAAMGSTERTARGAAPGWANARVRNHLRNPLTGADAVAGRHGAERN